jgi:hypothetical protein
MRPEKIHKSVVQQQWCHPFSMSDFVGAYEGSDGVVHRTKLRAEQH